MYKMVLKEFLLNKKGFVKQFSKFAIVGFLGTLLHLIVLYILTEFFGIYYMFSAVFAFIVAVTNNFILNKLWTFRKTSKGKTTRRYIKYFIIAVLAFFINLIFLYSLTEYFKIYYMLSQIFAILVSLWINFLGNKLWTFKDG